MRSRSIACVVSAGFCSVVLGAEDAALNKGGLSGSRLDLAGVARETAAEDGSYVRPPSRLRVTLDGDEGSSLWVGGKIQTRYQASVRDGQDDATGFSLRRVRIRLQGSLLDDRLGFRIRSEGGNGRQHELLEAYVDWKLTDRLTLRAGQSIGRLSRIWYSPNTFQLAVDRPIVINQTVPFVGLRSQGLELRYRDESDTVYFQFTDGSEGFNTGFNDAPDEFAFTARWDRRLSGAWSQFGELSSPPGSGFAAVVGAGFHYEDSDENTSQRFAWAADASVYGDGWVATAGYIARSAEDLNARGQPETLHSFFVESGRYVSDRVELFARYEFGRSSDRDIEDFSVITAGANVYFFGQPLKLSTDVSYAFNGVDSIFARTSDGFLADTDGKDGQVVLRTQLQILF